MPYEFSMEDYFESELGVNITVVSKAGPWKLSAASFLDAGPQEPSLGWQLQRGILPKHLREAKANVSYLNFCYGDIKVKLYTRKEGSIEVESYDVVDFVSENPEALDVLAASEKYLREMDEAAKSDDENQLLEKALRFFRVCLPDQV